MSTRIAISADELLQKIRAELSGGGCADCVPQQLAPLRPVAGGINWQVLEHPPCSPACQNQMFEACSRLAERYDVRWPGDGEVAALR